MIFLQYLFFLTIILITFYGIGEIVFRLHQIKLPKTDFSGVFFRLLLGSIVLVLLGSIFFSKGKTVFILLLPFLVIAYFFAKKEKKILTSDKNFDTAKSLDLFFLIKLFVPLVLIFTINFAEMYAGKDIWHTPHSDYVAYSKLSFYLVKYGVENFTVNPIVLKTQLVPYHYFEIWLNGILAFLLSINHLVTLKVITYSFLFFLTFLGICSLIKILGVKKDWLIMLYAFLSTIFTGIYFSFYENYRFLSVMDIFSQNIWSYNKLSVIYSFLVAIILCFWTGNYIWGYLLLIILPICYVTTLPAVAMTIGFMAFVNFFQKNKKDFLLLMGLLLLLLTTFFSFYTFFGEIPNVSNKTFHFLDAKEIRTKFNIVAGTSIHTLILYLPYVFIIFLFRSLSGTFIKTYFYNLLFLALPFFALLGWSILSNITDSVQVYFNLSTPLLNIFFALLAIYLINYSPKKKSKILLLTLFFLNLFFNFGTSFHSNKITESETLKELVNKIKNKNHISISLKKFEDYSTVFQKNTYSTFLGQYLVPFYSDAYSVDVSVHQMKIDSTSRYVQAEIKMLQNAPFYQYVEMQKAIGKFVSIEQSQLDFIKEYKIDYLITNKKTPVPKYIQDLAEEEVHFREDKFLFFKKTISYENPILRPEKTISTNQK